MIRLVLSANRELMHFLVIDRNVYYTDRKWALWIRCLPRPDNFITKIRQSRNAFPAFLINSFSFNEEEQREYDSAKSEKEIADIIIKDARTKGCRLVLSREGDMKDEELKKKILESEFVADISQAPKKEEVPTEKVISVQTEQNEQKEIKE